MKTLSNFSRPLASICLMALLALPLHADVIAAPAAAAVAVDSPAAPAIPTPNLTPKARAVSARTSRQEVRQPVSFQRIDLYAGEVRVIPVKPVSQVALGNGRIISSITLPNGELLLMADAPGDTSVHVWLKDGRQIRYTVHISENDGRRVLTDISSLIKPIDGVTVREIGGQVFIEGSIDPKARPRIAAIAKAFPKVVDLTFESDVTMKKMVHLDVRIMEFRKDALERIGIDWQATATGPTIGLRMGRVRALPGPTHFMNLVTNFTSIIQLMMTNGDAIDLASPRLSTRSGGEASFLAGGQIPIPTTNTTGQSNVTFKDYGIKLNFKPITDDNNNVLIKVETEISTIDPTNVVQGIPGFLTRRTTAEVNLKDGEPMVLSGLIDSSISNNVNKVPFLGSIPILGHLFRSEEFRNNRTELVIFVEPHIIESGKIDGTKMTEKAAEIEKKRDRMLKDNLAE